MMSLSIGEEYTLMEESTRTWISAVAALVLTAWVAGSAAEEPPLPWLGPEDPDRSGDEALGPRLGIPSGQCRIEVLGGLLGGALGGVVGSSMGKGDGKAVAAVAGSLIGYLLGSAVGRSIDELDEACVGQVLERAKDRQTVAWVDSDGQSRYEVTPTRTFQREAGYCRDYEVDALIQGLSRRGAGTACRDQSGRWKELR